MNVLITGSRDTDKYMYIHNQLDIHIDKKNDIIIHGDARGVDRIAKEWCKINNVKDIPIKALKPDNKTYYLYRNCEMIGMADKVIAFWNGSEKSTGTPFTINYAKARGKTIVVFDI
jgi:hypothetical protein